MGSWLLADVLVGASEGRAGVSADEELVEVSVVDQEGDGSLRYSESELFKGGHGRMALFVRPDGVGLGSGNGVPL